MTSWFDGSIHSYVASQGKESSEEKRDEEKHGWTSDELTNTFTTKMNQLQAVHNINSSHSKQFETWEICDGMCMCVCVAEMKIDGECK